MAQCPHVFDSSKTTGHPSIFVQILDNIFANV